MLVGNPGQPLLQPCGVLVPDACVSFRAGYLDDMVYKQRFKDEFPIEGEEPSNTHLKLSTYAGLFTLNLSYIDLYGILGSSRLQVDEEIFTKRAFSWGTGAKCILFYYGNFYLGADGSYFQTKQKPRYLDIGNEAYLIMSSYRLDYSEIQGAIGITYKMFGFAPYVNLTYLQAKMKPNPLTLLARMPQAADLVDVPTVSVETKKPWGMALGLTWVDNSRASLTFEWRAFNQNAIDLNGEIRF